MGEPEKSPVPVAIEARLEVCQIIGRMMELWGFRKNLGRIWTLLYLSDEPVSAGEIGEHLSLSRGSTSMALQELLRWGVVRKSWKPGERKDFFEAEQNVVKMILRVLNERELPAINEAIHSLEDVLRSLDEEGSKGADPVLYRRTGDLLRMTETGRGLFKNLLGPNGPATPFLRGFGAAMEDRS